jgi:TolB protein
LPVDDFLSRPSDESEVKYKDWRLIKAVNLVVGRVTQMGTDRYAVRFQLFDIFRERQLAGFRWEVTGSDLRKIAHQISDKVYEALTGRPGAFDSRIAYVTLLRTASKGSEYQLMVADADGYNPMQILRSPDPILSPAWAADGAWLAYVSFEDGRSKIFVQNLNTGARKKLAEFPGINGAPAWSPDGKHMAMTLSRDGNPEIYVMHIASGSLRRLTNHSSIDTEAAWSPDGRHLVFTSDRAGRPQIYRMSAAGGRAERLTFEGKENARASYDRTGKHLTLVTNQGNGDQIGVFSLSKGSLEILTDGRFDESPTFAPNGAMILYAAQRGGSGLLSAVSADGRVRQVLRSESGTVREPAWSSLNR